MSNQTTFIEFTWDRRSSSPPTSFSDSVILYRLDGTGGRHIAVGVCGNEVSLWLGPWRKIHMNILEWRGLWLVQYLQTGNATNFPNAMNLHTIQYIFLVLEKQINVLFLCCLWGFWNCQFPFENLLLRKTFVIFYWNDSDERFMLWHHS